MDKQPQLAEVTVTKQELESALEKLKETGGDKLTMLVSCNRLWEPTTFGGFGTKTGAIHCRYGKEDPPASA